MRCKPALLFVVMVAAVLAAAGSRVFSREYEPFFPREPFNPPEEAQWVEETLRPWLEKHPHWRREICYAVENQPWYLQVVHSPNEGPFADDLEELETLPGLTRLEVRGHNVTAEGLKVLPRLASLTRIYLTPFNDALTPEDLAVVGRMKGLRQLHLYMPFDNRGLSWLGELESLEYLTLNGPAIDDAGLAFIAECRQLRRLVLSGFRMEKITGDGFKHLSKLPELQELDLTGLNGLTRDGIKQIAQLPHLRHIRFNQVRALDDELVEILKQMPEMWKVETELCPGVKKDAATILPLSFFLKP